MTIHSVGPRQETPDERGAANAAGWAKVRNVQREYDFAEEFGLSMSGDDPGELITDPAEIEQIKARMQYTSGEYDTEPTEADW